MRWFLLILLSLIWGSSFILIKEGLKGFTFMQLAMLRMFAASSTLLVFAVPHVFKVSQTRWKFIILSALTGNFIPAILFAGAETKLDSGITGVLNALTPIFTLLVSIFLYKDKIKQIQKIGILIGFAGCICITATSVSLKADSSLILYAGMILLATLCYGISVNVIKHHLVDIHPLALASLSLATLLLPSAGYLLSTDFITRLQSMHNFSPLYSVLILGVLGSAISLVFFNRLVQLSSTLFASSVTYTIPIVALAWAVYAGEKIHFLHIIGMLLIIVGIYCVNKK
ncbi:MAG: DMT family transporter [Bacteroidia bacterium]|nr:DMT family transporter [Bacteroidia bacterium]MDW8300924.1 DMT family transporter [Bacteroidia bacterium]